MYVFLSFPLLSQVAWWLKWLISCRSRCLPLLINRMHSNSTSVVWDSRQKLWSDSRTSGWRLREEGRLRRPQGTSAEVLSWKEMAPSNNYRFLTPETTAVAKSENTLLCELGYSTVVIFWNQSALRQLTSKPLLPPSHPSTTMGQVPALGCRDRP